MPSDTQPGLTGVRVLQFPDHKTALCGRLLAAMGADVVLAEPPGGATLRHAPPHAGDTGEGLFFWYTAADTRSVALDLRRPEDRTTLLGLAAAADVLLDPFPPGHLASLGLGDKAIFAANPRLVFASVTPFGQTGPFRDYRGSDIVGWATGGLMGTTGDPAREPLNAPALQASQVASIWATIAVLGALWRRLETGQGARIDLSVQDAVFDMSETAHSFYLCNGDVVKRLNGDHPIATPFKVYKSKDGYCFVSASTRGQWSEFLEWMASYGVDVAPLREMDLLSAPERLKRRDEINRVVGQFALRASHEELWVGGAQRGIANGPVRAVRETLQDDQLAFRGFFGWMADPRPGMEEVRHPYPGLPFRGEAGPLRPGHAPPPRPGQHTAEVLVDWAKPGRSWPAPRMPHRALPLESIRVVETCHQIAGPTMGRVLADLGATVVKLEPREVGDPSRNLVPFPDRRPHLEHSYTFQDMNRNKLSVTLNLKHPHGRDLALALARRADAWVENYSAGTLERLGIGYETLAAANPRLVVASNTGYGQQGPRRGWPCNHPTAAALAGLIGLFAYEGGEPLGFGNSYTDFIAGYFGAIGVMEGLFRRELTGRGDHVDASMVECAANLVGAQLLDWAVNRRDARGEGNRAGALGAPLQGVYRCAGTDRWIAVTAPDREALASLAHLVGALGGASPAEAATALASWTALRDPWEAFHALQRAGVPAGVVEEGPDFQRDEQLQHRGAIAWVPHAELGKAPIVQCPIFLDGQRLSVRMPGPLLGEHTEQVLKGTLGLGEQEYLQRVVEEAV